MSRPTPLQRAALAIVALTTFVAAGGWLGLSYFGVVSSDVKVAVATATLGDSLGPGAKVRYHGIIVGRVLSVGESGTEYRVRLLVDSRHAGSIPSTATARILPSTIFGSEYVELLSTRDAGDRPRLASGDVLRVDTSEETLRLMDSFDDAQQLISSVDVEQMNRALDRLAPALDGHGADIADFLRRGDDFVTTLNQDAAAFYRTLALVPGALDVLADIEPDLVSAMTASRTTADLLVDKDADIGSLLTSTRHLADTAHTLVDRHGDAIVDLSDTLAPLSATLARHRVDVRDVVHRAPTVLHNGAAATDDNAIQMLGTIGIDPLDPYDAHDCPRYGAMAGGNCGNSVPPAPAAASDSDIADIAGRVEDLLAQLDQEGSDPADDRPVDGTSAPAPAPADGAGLLGDLFELLRGLGGSLTVDGR